MATIHTVDKKKIEVEIGAAKLDEELSHVAARGVPVLKVKLAGKDEFVWVNANHVVSFSESGE